jgi:TP901 family phage tail tape measure protein
MNIGSLTVTLGIDATQLAAANLAMDNFAKKTTSSLARVNSSLQRFGYLATTALTLPLVMAGKATFQFAKDYEYSIQKIVGLTGVAQTTVNEWSKDLLAMGPQLGRTPQELADALYFISSSGIKGAEAMNVLALSAKAATAGLGDTKTVADLLTSALNAYAGTGLTAQKATDVLVAAVREGKAEASGFATAMGQIIPIAAQLGVRFDEVAGGMAAITLTGASSANAAVYLKGVFNSLLTASTKGEKALNSVGTSYAQLRNILSSQGLIPLMQKLRDIQMKYGDELLSDVLPNIRGLTGYLSLAGKNFKYNTDLMNRVTNSAGSLGKAFAAVSDTIKVRYDKAISGAQVSMISLGKSIAESVLPFLEKLIKKLGELTQWFNNLSESSKKMVLKIAGIAAALGPLSLLVSAFVWILRGLISVGGTVTGIFTTLFTVVAANPWILAVAGAVALVAALVHARNRTADFADSQSVLKGVLIDVNGEMKKMQDLTKTDYSSMSVTGLSAAYATAWNTALEAKKRYDGYVAARKGETKLNAWLKGGKYDILEESAYKDWNTAKTVLEEIGKAFGLISKSADDAAKAITTVSFAVGSSLMKGKEWSDFLKNALKGLDFETTAHKAFKIMGADMSGSGTLYKGEFGKSGSWAEQQKAIEQYNNSLISQNTIINELSQNFEDMFKHIGGGFKGMIQAFIDSIKLLLAELAGKAVLLALANIFAPGSGFAVNIWKNLFKFTGGIGFGGAHAMGTNYAKGGLSLVGERGPELVNLPRGSRVYPNNMLGAGRQTIEFEPVEIVIKENTMTGFLKKANVRKSLY